MQAFFARVLPNIVLSDFYHGSSFKKRRGASLPSLVNKKLLFFSRMREHGGGGVSYSALQRPFVRSLGS